MAVSYRKSFFKISGLGASIQADKQAQQSHATVPLSGRKSWNSRALIQKNITQDIRTLKEYKMRSKICTMDRCFQLEKFLDQ